MRKGSAAVQKQPLVTRHPSDQNTPSNLPSTIIEAAHTSAHPSKLYIQPRLSCDSAHAVSTPLPGSQAAAQERDSTASDAAALSCSSNPESVADTPQATACSLAAGVKADVLPGATPVRQPFAVVQSNRLGATAPLLTGKHSSSTPAEERQTQQTVAEALLTQPADLSVPGTVAHQMDDPAAQQRCDAACVSEICSSSGSYGMGHSGSQQASHTRQPASASSLDTAVSSSAAADAHGISHDVSVMNDATDRGEHAASARGAPAEFVPIAAAPIDGGAGLPGNAPGRVEGSHQGRATKSRSGIVRTSKQTKSKGPSVEVSCGCIHGSEVPVMFLLHLPLLPTPAMLSCCTLCPAATPIVGQVQLQHVDSLTVHPVLVLAP